VTGTARFYIDTNVVIAIIEAPGALTPGQMAFLEDVDRGRIKAVTSELTLAECLVKPMADRNANAVEAYLTFLDNRPELPVLPVSRAILIEAARLRGETGIKMPDAIHVATALEAGCGVFVTNDRRIKVAAKIRIQWWNELSAVSPQRGPDGASIVRSADCNQLQ
jgi:predicted nucleic acid-binding protein